MPKPMPFESPPALTLPPIEQPAINKIEAINTIFFMFYFLLTKTIFTFIYLISYSTRESLQFLTSNGDFMKLYKYLAIFLAFITHVSYANLLSISEQEINQYLNTRLAEKFPLKDSVGIPGLFQLDYHLQQLTTQIGRTDEKRVEAQGAVDGLLRLKGKRYNIQLTLNLDTLPYYDSEKGALYLKEIRLKQWKLSPEKYQHEVQPFVAPLFNGLASILDSQPVYTLDENNTKEAIAKKFAKSIIVEPGKISLETSIF